MPDLPLRFLWRSGCHHYWHLVGTFNLVFVHLSMRANLLYNMDILSVVFFSGRRPLLIFTEVLSLSPRGENRRNSVTVQSIAHQNKLIEWPMATCVNASIYKLNIKTPHSLTPPTTCLCMCNEIDQPLVDKWSTWLSRQTTASTGKRKFCYPPQTAHPDVDAQDCCAYIPPRTVGPTWH